MRVEPTSLKLSESASLKGKFLVVVAVCLETHTGRRIERMRNFISSQQQFAYQALIMKAERANARLSPWTVPILSRRPISLLKAFSFTLMLCAHASAAIIDTYPDWDGSVTRSYFKVAQTFLAPADNTLASWQFTLAPSGGWTNVLFEIVPWNSTSGPNGSPLFSRSVNWPAQGGDVLVENINLTLMPATRYAAIVDLGTYAGPSLDFELNRNSYSQGNAAWFAGINPTWNYLDSSYNTTFRAQFYAVPEPANLFGLGLASVALLRVLTRKMPV